MIQIKLFTRDGGFVADKKIPAFQLLPEVVIWGERAFALVPETANAVAPEVPHYREVFVFVVHSGA